MIRESKFHMLLLNIGELNMLIRCEFIFRISNYIIEDISEHKY
jgi:hypothetical protein